MSSTLAAPPLPPTHYYAWRSGRKPLYGRPCRILEDAGRNVLVEFTDDGQREVVSRRAVRRIAP